MPNSIINSDDGAVSGTSGLKTTGGDNGALVLQNNGTTAVTISGGNVTFANPNRVQAGTAAAPSITPDGDTNTGIYFPGADRIGFSEGGVQCGEFDASGNFKMNSGYGSAANAYGVRAWANFNGQALTIRSSGNVSSITDVSTGNASYRVNFTNALPDVNYAASGSFYGYPSTNWTAYFSSVGQTTSYCEVRASGFVSVSGGYVVAEVANATGGGSFTNVSVMIVR